MCKNDDKNASGWLIKAKKHFLSVVKITIICVLRIWHIPKNIRFSVNTSSVREWRSEKKLEDDDEKKTEIKTGSPHAIQVYLDVWHYDYDFN